MVTWSSDKEERIPLWCSLFLTMSEETSEEEVLDMNPNGMWGLYSEKDKCWLGNDKGPIRYGNRFTARVALTIIYEQARNSQHPVTYRPKKGTEEEFRNVRYKDRIDLARTGEEAIRNIERYASNDPTPNP